MVINSSLRRQVKNIVTNLYQRVRHEHFQNELDYAIEMILEDIEKRDLSELTIDNEVVNGVVVPFAPMFSAITETVIKNDKEYVRCPDDWIVVLATDDSAKLVRETTDLLRPYGGRYEDVIVNDVTYKTATNRDLDGIFDLLYC